MSALGVEVFGAVAVTCMAICYALEDRSPRFVLMFAFACAASSLYAVMIRSWPFAVVEILWAAVAVRRWQRLTRAG